MKYILILVLLVFSGIYMPLTYAQMVPPDARQTYLEKTLKLQPDDSKMHMELAHIYLEKTQFLPALIQFLEVLRIDPDNPRAHGGALIAYWELSEQHGISREMIFREVYHIEQLTKPTERNNKFWDDLSYSLPRMKKLVSQRLEYLMGPVSEQMEKMPGDNVWHIDTSTMSEEEKLKTYADAFKRKDLVLPADHISAEKKQEAYERAKARFK